LDTNTLMKLILLIVITLLISYCDDPILEKRVGSDPMDLLWELQYDRKGWGADAPPSLINNSLLLYTGDNNITCVNIESGNIKYVSALDYAGSLLKRFVFDNSNIFGFRSENNIYALDISDGTINWEKDIDSCQSFSFRLSVDQDHYFVGISSHKVNSPYSILKYSKAGFLLDSVATNHMPWILSNYDDKLFCSQGWSPVGSSNDIGQIISFDIITMDTLWYYEGSGSFIHYPVFQDGVMYVGTVWGADNKVLALNAQTGEIIWENNSDNISAIKVMLVNDLLYVETGASVRALNKETGSQIWRSNLPNPDESPTLSYLDGYIYIENYGTLYILDASTGERVYSMRSPDNASVEQISTGVDKIFVQSTQHLYAFTPYEAD